MALGLADSPKGNVCAQDLLLENSRLGISCYMPSPFTIAILKKEKLSFIVLFKKITILTILIVQFSAIRDMQNIL